MPLREVILLDDTTLAMRVAEATVSFVTQFEGVEALFIYSSFFSALQKYFFHNIKTMRILKN